MPSIDPAEALRRSLQALQEGQWDPRSLEGARQNALASIAWSLAGILAQMQQRDEPGASRPRPRRRPQDTTLDARRH